MASTFDENKRMKSDHSSCQSWFQHIGLEKSNNFPYSAKLFSARRNTKTSSKSVDKSDPSTTDQGNGQDSELGEAEPTEDSDPDLHRLQSSWNDFCLVYCDNCSYHYAHSAFMRHQVNRHVQVLDDSVYQHSLYTEKTIPVHDQKKKKVKNGRRKIVQSQTKNPVETEDTKNIESKSNVVSNLDVKSGPGPGHENWDFDSVNGNVKSAPGSGALGSEPVNEDVKFSPGNRNFESDPVNGNGKSAPGNGNRKKKKRKAVFGTKNKKPRTDLKNPMPYRLIGGGGQHCMEEYSNVGTFLCPVDRFPVLLDVSPCGNSSSECLENNQSKNYTKLSPEPLIVNNVLNYEAEKFPPQSIHYENKLDNIFSKDNVFLNSKHVSSTSKMEITQNTDDDNVSLFLNSKHVGSTSEMELSQNSDDTSIKLNCHTSWTSRNDHSTDYYFQDVFNKKCQIGTPPKRFNGDLKKESAHIISSVKCVENQGQESIFLKENDAYLKKLGNGCELKSWKTKPVVKLKREEIQGKLINQLASPMYNKCLETIKLEPMKIKKALNSINRVCKTRKLEQFRTFSHLKRLMPSSKNSPHRTRVSCSVNTGAKSACFKTGNKVPNRNQSRKSFYPLMGKWEAESGLVFQDSTYSTLRNTFNYNELDSSIMEKMDFLNMNMDMDLFQSENYAMPTTALETLMETETVTTLINPVVTVKNENYIMPTTTFETPKEIEAATTMVNPVFTTTLETPMKTEAVTTLINHVVTVKNESYTMPTTTVETPKEIEAVKTMINPVVTTTLQTPMETGAVATTVNPVVTTTLETPREAEAMTTMINPVVTVKNENYTLSTTTVETSMETEAVTSIINSVATEVENETVETIIYPVETEAVTSIINSIVSEVENEAVKTTIYPVVTTNEIDSVTTISKTVSYVINNDTNTNNTIAVVISKAATNEIEKLVYTNSNFKAGLESNEHEGKQNGLLPSLNESPPWDSDRMESNNLDSGYLSHYDHQPGSSKSGSPDSFPVSPSYSATFEDNKVNKGPRQNLMCFLPTKGHNGMNGFNYLDHNRKPKQGCTDR